MTEHMSTNSTTTSSKLADYATSVILKNTSRESGGATEILNGTSSPNSTSSATLISGSNNLNLSRPSFYEITKEYYSKHRQKNNNSNNKLKSLDKNVIIEENEHDLLDIAVDRPKSNRLKPINMNDNKNSKLPKSSSTNRSTGSKHQEMVPPSIKSTTSIDENIIEQSIDLNLYKTSPTIAFIKQKYKMYLEWLNENNKKDALTKNGSGNPNGKTLNINQLTWYSYERSLRTQHNSHSQPKKINSNSSKKVTIEISTESKNVNNIKSNPQNNIKNFKLNNSSLSTMSTSGISSSVLSSTSSIENNLNSSFSKNVTFINQNEIKNKKQKNHTSYLTLKKINQSNTSLNNTINMNANHLTTSTIRNPNNSNNSTPMLSMTSQPANIKPILKSSILSNSMNDYYYNSSSLVGIGNVNGGGAQIVRRDSMQSSTDSNNDMNNSLTNMNLLRKSNTCSINGSLSSMSKTNIGANGGLITKLPPIARGSNDFNAVMQDLKKKEF
jgi:hypothetical protein